MAMTTRPQLGSSPKMADFRIGELAQAKRDRARGRPALGPADLDGDELRQALAVLGDLDGKIAHQIVQGGAEGGER